MKTIVLSKDELIELLDQRLEFAISKLEFQEKNKKEEDKLLTRHDVAQLFGVTLVTVNEWCKKDILITHRMNSRVYFYKSEVMEALNSRTQNNRR